MNINPFDTQGRIRGCRSCDSSTIEYHVRSDVHWVVFNHGKSNERWYSYVARRSNLDDKYEVKISPLEEREVEQFKTEIAKQEAIRRFKEECILVEIETESIHRNTTSALAQIPQITPTSKL